MKWLSKLAVAMKIISVLDELQDLPPGETTEIPETRVKVGRRKWILGPTPARWEE